MNVVVVTKDNCPGCIQLKPILESIDHEFEYIHGPTNPEFLMEHSVLAAPTVLFFKDDQELYRFSGVRPKSFIEELIAKLGE